MSLSSTVKLDGGTAAVLIALEMMGWVGFERAFNGRVHYSPRVRLYMESLRIYALGFRLDKQTTANCFRTLVRLVLSTHHQ